MSTSNPYAAKRVGPTKKQAVVVEEEAVEEVHDNEVPSGTITEVKTWVGEDQERAQTALEAEEASDSPRKTLVDHLKDILNSDD